MMNCPASRSKLNRRYEKREKEHTGLVSLQCRGDVSYFSQPHIIILNIASADPVTGVPPYVRTFSCTTAVQFDTLSDEAIQAYIATGDCGRGFTKNGLMCPTSAHIAHVQRPFPPYEA